MPRASRQSGKQKRVPFGSKRMKLAPRGKLPSNYYYHWFNDEQMNILEAQEAGYSFVRADNVPLEDGDDSMSEARQRKQVGTNEKGEPKFAYLMAKPMQWYEEDFASKQKKVDDNEKAITHGQATALAKKMGDNMYVDPANRITAERIKREQKN